MRLPKWFKKNTADLPTLERLTQLEYRMDVYEGQFKTLRGYVYARKGSVGDAMDGQPSDAPSAAAPSSVGGVTKDELRRQLALSGRMMPGKPTKM